MNPIAEGLETGQAQEVAGAFLDAVDRFDRTGDRNALYRDLIAACRLAEGESDRVALLQPVRPSDDEIRAACQDFAAMGYSRADVSALLGYSRPHFTREVLARIDPENRIPWPSRGWGLGHQGYQAERRGRVSA